MVYKDCNKAVIGKGESFSANYFLIHKHVMHNGIKVQSRNGEVFEIINFNTEIREPLRRCIGGYERKMNIFFLLAEAIWIFKGRRDVQFMDIFNSKLKNYSDDGKYYHAPYGWRLRKFDLDSTVEDCEESLYGSLDQVKSVLVELNKNPESRRAVMQIWNSNQDLGATSKDLPCNSIVFLKIRNRGLVLTIGNRSNDLDFGLTTNVFQFGFIGEIMAAILGVNYAKQIHNSDSLHLYKDNYLTSKLNNLYGNLDKDKCYDFYDNVDYLKMNFNFPNEHCENEEERITRRLFWVDFYLHGIILRLSDRINTGEEELEDFEKSLLNFCPYFYYVFKILSVYVDYKKSYNDLCKKSKEDHVVYVNIDKIRLEAIDKLIDIGRSYNLQFFDFYILSLNWFISPLTDMKEDCVLRLHSVFPMIDFNKMKMGYL